ncbi:MAG: hypothetical protein KBF57_06700 [Saprospiraceae bacterium]|nr:hypothetical protein [Saprospiraceae bacterium]
MPGHWCWDPGTEHPGTGIRVRSIRLRSIRVRSIRHIEELSLERQLVSYLVSERFRRFLLSHARYINETRGRTGSLFQKAFRRKHLFDPSDVKSVITYINHNPIHHGIGGDYNSYDWTSYKSSIHNYTSLINKTKLWTLFSDVSGFIEEHKRYQQHRWENERYYIEEV